MPALAIFPAPAPAAAPADAPAAIVGQKLDSPPSPNAYKTVAQPFILISYLVLLTVVLVGLRLSGVWLGKLTSRGARTRARDRDMNSKTRSDGRGDEKKGGERKWKVGVVGDEDSGRQLPMPQMMEFDVGQQYTPIPFTQEPASYFWADEELRSQHSILSSSPQQSQSSIDSISTSSESAPATWPLSPDIPRRRSYTKAVASNEGEIKLEGEILETESWRRHTRVYGGGVCLACLESDERNEKIRKMLRMEQSE